MTMRDPPDASTVSHLDRLLDEQDRRFARGEQVLVEPLLEAQPELRRQTELVLDLIYHEIHLRQQAGERPILADYQQRFPDFEDALRLQFEVHRALEAERSSAVSDPTAPVPQAPPGIMPPQGGCAESRYRILRPHARGGLGEVFIAEDRELEREVALKEIQSQFAADEASRTRFVLEAQTTGNLEHPGIVPVYGLGAYADGRPFYAMRFIRGTSQLEAITEYHAAGAADPARHLRLRDLLRRLGDVCNAMQYAHDRGVIDRDLKPGNIMLGKYGETLVVDWGLAKLIGRTAAAAHSEEASLRVGGSGSIDTVAGAAIGTPAYMSPEQAAGQHHLVGRASDVYSLGAVLYCLLTGQPPYQGSTADVLARVPYGEYPPPRQVMPEVTPPLEAICMKAMALRPQDRYGSPRELADDLERWLAGEPVRAWPEPWTIRTGRWLRRHKPLVSSAAAALLVALLGAMIGLLWYQHEQDRRAASAALAEASVRHALGEGEQRRDELHAILRQKGGVFGLLNRPEQWQARIESARDAVKRANVLLANATEELDSQLAADAARLNGRLRQDDDDRLLAVGLEKIRVDRSLLVQGKYDHRSAARAYPRAFAEAHLPILAEDSATIAAQIGASPIREQLVAALDDWAIVAFHFGNDSMAERLLAVGRAALPDPAWGDRLRQLPLWRDRKALKSLVHQAPDAPHSPSLLHLIVSLIGNDPDDLAWHRRAQAQYSTDYLLNYALGTALGKLNPTEAAGFLRVALAVRPESSAAYNNLGGVFAGQKKLREAITAFNKAIEIDPRYAAPYNNLGNAFADQHKLPEAIAAFNKAIELNPKNALAYNGLGTVLGDQKKLTEAIVAYNKAIEIDPKDAGVHYNLGNAFRAQKKLPEAIAAYITAIKINPKDSKTYHGLGRALADEKKLPEAIATYNKAIELDPKNAFAYNGLGIALDRQNKVPEAIAAYNKAIDHDPNYAEPHYNLGILFRRQNKVPEAIAAYNKAIDVDPNYALAYNDLGGIFGMQNKLPEAIAACNKAIELDPNNVLPYNNLGNALLRQKKLPQAIAAFNKAIEVDPNNALPYNGRGTAFAEQNKLPEAIAAFKKAIEIDPQFAAAFHNLGDAFRMQKKVPEAVGAYNKAIELDPRFPNARMGLGVALEMLGAFDEAAKAFRQAVELLPPRDPWRALAEKYIKHSNAMHVLEKRLPNVLEGTESPTPVEMLQLAVLCQQFKKRHSAAVQLYQKAFAARPALADNSAAAHRFKAACSAVLAGTGQAEDAVNLGMEEKAALRRQAHAWLQAELDRDGRHLHDGNASTVVAIEPRLAQWQTDRNLAAVRDTKALAALPEEEAQDWQKLWADVAGLLIEVRGRFTERRVDGELSALDTSRVHEWNMVAGRGYVIDMESAAFDTLLKLHDPAGKQLAENDDIDPGVNLNSRLIFTAPVDGVYRIVATSFQQAGVGPYVLRIREVRGK
jgi:tetratricopeptide (TPR) repeat protein